MYVLKIDTLFFYYQWPFTDMCMDGSDIFAYDPYKEQLYWWKEKHADNHRGGAYLEPVPENEFIYQVNKGNYKAYCSRKKANKNWQAQWQFWMAGKAQHCKVV